MMRKIFSFVTIHDMTGDTFKFPSLKDPVNLSEETTIRHLGYMPETNEQFFSYEEDATVFPDEPYDEKYKFKIYDNSVKADFDKLKLFLKDCPEVHRYIQEIGDKQFGMRPLYNWLLAIIDNDEEVINLLRNIRKTQDEYLQSLGFAGLSQFYQ